MKTTTSTGTIEDRATILELRDEVAVLRGLLDGEWPAGAHRMQGKIDRQRFALDRLQRRVENQRLVLRTVNELGRGLTDNEWAAARGSVPSDQLRGRMNETQPSAA